MSSSLLDMTICPACNFVMSPPSRDPLISITCGHTICKNCIWQNHECPVCRKQIISAAKNFSIITLIEALRRTNIIPAKMDPAEPPLPKFPNSAQPSEVGPFCTYQQFNRKYIHQKFYHCHTCNLVGPLGCCEACAKRCHIGHDVSEFSETVHCYCDCGANPDHKCISCTPKHEVCTISKFGDKNYVKQKWYYCLTCNLRDGLGCCEVCARNCHFGHKVIYQGEFDAFCDCQQATNKCICQS
ncbi:hypothetical protein TRFO_23795 [Tritrichomonas foetus]|uniref:RING-type domain-containing protein n=1 Tax=Tritrichomonas foetus TaxID=1144522 RepID=A0A1J4KA60_9EUKA|nr:hypothetical protein TRFO_23795 [Tritrichomonas foetus]|eukprot:OHT07850.1 hypothetical protein TRFO_23795 [Tritrichomonas foetus]